MILFIQISTNAIGHAVRDTEIYIRRYISYKNEKFSDKIFFYRARNVSNRTWFKLLKNEMVFVPRFIGVFAHKILNKYSRKYHIKYSNFVKVEKKDLQNSESIVIPLFSTNVSLNNIKHSTFKFNSDSNFVCILVRDNLYDFKFGSENVKNQAYRNTPINYFYPAINLINDYGYMVIRMGRDINPSEAILGTNYLELANLKPKLSELAEIVLFEKCKFLITTNTGPDALGTFFRRPTFRINAAPFHHLWPAPIYPFTLIPDYIEIESNRKLTFDEVRNESHKLILPYRSPEDNGIYIKPKSEKVIKLLVEAALHFVKNNNVQYKESILKAVEFGNLEMDNNFFLY